MRLDEESKIHHTSTASSQPNVFIRSLFPMVDAVSRIIDMRQNSTGIPATLIGYAFRHN